MTLGAEIPNAGMLIETGKAVPHLTNMADIQAATAGKVAAVAGALMPIAVGGLMYLGLKMIVTGKNEIPLLKNIV